MKNKKGFTLIELLAVIVILGLLMAIAIPSVTKYITESRKKTLTTTVGNYIGALVNDVNDLSYTFTGYNTIYAVPIECISLERGGTNPFGHWYQANNSYFAYVLVQYDDSVSKYIYGFTFKDSAGYGLYPTIQANIKEKGSQIKTGYTLNKPETGDLTSLTSLSKWQESGFKVDSNTYLQVLEATSENETGDGINTCTLQQKGDNYAQIEEEKIANRVPCSIVSGSGYALGNKVSCGSEEFYIADISGSSITMFTATWLNVHTNKQLTSSESIDDLPYVHLASSAYWLNGSTLKSKYGTSYPAYVYDENSLYYSYLNNYQTYLRNNLGVSTAVVKMIDAKLLIKLGCNLSGSTCKNAPSWVHNSSSLSFLTGSVDSSKRPYFVWVGSFGAVIEYNNVSSIPRPMVIVDKSDFE